MGSESDGKFADVDEKEADLFFFFLSLLILM